MIIDNVYINDFLLTVKRKITLNIYNFVKYIGSSDLKRMEWHHIMFCRICNCLSTTRLERKIILEEFKRYDSYKMKTQAN